MVEFFLKLKERKPVVIAIIFVIVLLVFYLFSIQDKIFFKNIAQIGEKYGLGSGNNNDKGYDKMTVGDLVNKDTDGDGVLDWEEGLWGTDPNKKDTDDNGVPDDLEIDKMKIAKGINPDDPENKKEENLTETEKFARELFATTAALNQTGVMDEKAIDKITTSVAEQIKNPVIRKVYLISDLKIIQDNSLEAAQKYFQNLGNLIDKHKKKYPISAKMPQILNDFVSNSTDNQKLSEFNLLIDYTKGNIDLMLSLEIPKEFGLSHLNIINTWEQILENLIDIKLVDSDPIIAMGAVNKFQININLLEENIKKHIDIIIKKSQ